VREEPLEPGAQVVESRLAVRRPQQPVLRTLAPAVGQEFAATAECGQRLRLGIAEAHLAGREHHVAERRLLDVTEPVLGIDVVIAGIDAAVVLERDALAAELGVHADLRWQPQALRHQRLAEIDQHLAEVAGRHSSQTLLRKWPYSSGSTDHGVTTDCGWSGRASGAPIAGRRAASHFCGATVSKSLGSTIE